jgi:hypothetical protein
MKSTIGFLGTLVLAYLAGAFVNADFNPSTWGVAARAFVAFAGIFWAAGVAAALYDE